MKQSSRNKDMEGAEKTRWWERSPLTNLAWVRFRPSAICGLNLVLVLVPAPRAFFFQDLRFSSLRKNHHSKFQFDPEMRATGLSAIVDSQSQTTIKHESSPQWLWGFWRLRKLFTKKCLMLPPSTFLQKGPWSFKGSVVIPTWWQHH